MYCIIASLVDHEMSPPTLLHIATAPEGRIQTEYHNKLVLHNQSLDPTNLAEVKRVIEKRGVNCKFQMFYSAYVVNRYRCCL